MALEQAAGASPYLPFVVLSLSFSSRSSFSRGYCSQASGRHLEPFVQHPQSPHLHKRHVSRAPRPSPRRHLDRRFGHRQDTRATTGWYVRFSYALVALPPPLPASPRLLSPRTAIRLCLCSFLSLLCDSVASEYLLHTCSPSLTIHRQDPLAACRVDSSRFHRRTFAVSGGQPRSPPLFPSASFSPSFVTATQQPLNDHPALCIPAHPVWR